MNNGASSKRATERSGAEPTAGPSNSVAATLNTANPPTETKSLATCPKCKRQSLHVQSMQGEDDHGRIEGGMELCEECGYEDSWGYRC